MAYGPKPKPWPERFWPKVDKRGPDECWEWQGTCEPNSYGVFYVGPGRKMDKAHRISWQMANGREIPPGGFICHHCDNRPCVNPAHLYLGDYQTNAQDRATRRRGRENRQDGENNTNAKLTEADVRAIIAELQKVPRRSQASIAAQFGVKQAQVSRIMRRENWAHLWDE